MSPTSEDTDWKPGMKSNSNLPHKKRRRSSFSAMIDPIPNVPTQNSPLLSSLSVISPAPSDTTKIPTNPKPGQTSLQQQMHSPHEQPHKQPIQHEQTKLRLHGDQEQYLHDEVIKHEASLSRVSSSN